MSSETYDKGIEMLGKMVGPDVLQDTVDKVKKFSPDFANMIVSFPYGMIYSRPGLDLKQRSLVAISALIASGSDAQLDFHIHAGLNAGLTPDEIIEAIMNCLPYAGFPKSISGLFVTMRVFEERGIKPGESENVD
ncbi:carboxymuconolactone decarboxylase family protein [Paenibacillus sp. PAMC21692]|uniref:carboxymuconolactone decarboxylase family protein n=1 Tax=Paenibacillus sp. PAMC21692 TaxID=2762320 RepID=UPI00164EC12C|nr:carboxymuconolactone decarboxylase family protein [Paenibacillus sp. PAMC21692]QNK56420.1 carboxymuconolactone decarboxylase family protein [Paenibacillus sp. PAMC21692]